MAMTGFRQYFRTCIFQAFLWVACAVTMAGAHAEELLDSIVATIDDQVITQQALYMNLARAKASLRKQNTTEVDDRNLLAQVLQQMITQKLQLQEARRLNISIDEITLDRAIAQMASNYSMNLDQFRQRIQMEGGDYEMLREQVRESLTINRLVQREVVDRIEVTEEEVRNYLTASGNQPQKNTEYHLAQWQAVFSDSSKNIPKSYQSAVMRLMNTLSNESIATFARLKQRSRSIWKEFWQKRGYTAQKSAVSGKPAIPRYVLTDLGWKKLAELPDAVQKRIQSVNVGEAGGAGVDGKKFHWFYLFGIRNREHSATKKQYHVRHILLQTNPLEGDDVIRKRLAKIKRAIERGGDFAAFAQKYSQDTGSAFTGGDLGWNSPQNFTAEFAAAITRNHGDQSIVGPFKSSFGWHLLEVLDEREEDVGDTMARREAIAAIKQSKLAKEQRLWLLNLRETYHIEVRL